MREEKERAEREARAAQLARDLEIQRQREEEIRNRQEAAKKRMEEQRLKDIEEETRKMEEAKQEMLKMKQALDFERSQMFAQRKADSIRRQKQKRADDSPVRGSLSPRDDSEDVKRVKFSSSVSTLLVTRTQVPRRLRRPHRRESDRGSH